MVYCRLLMLFVFWVCMPSVQAVLPGDAGFRQKEIFDYRQRKIAEFEEAKQQHEAELVSRSRQVRQEMALPPWGAVSSSAAAKTGAIHSEQRKAGFVRQGRKWIFSIIALLFIGGGVWWVKSATETEPDR